MKGEIHVICGSKIWPILMARDFTASYQRKPAQPTDNKPKPCRRAGRNTAYFWPRQAGKNLPKLD
jgi:hypothetical protein